MDEERTNKRRPSDQRLPWRQDHVAPNRIHNREAEQPRCVTQKMTGRISKKDQPSDEPDFSFHGAIEACVGIEGVASYNRWARE
jgi:hypothetical protein